MFVVVDLFYDVPQFDRIRPRAELYRAMRQTAHEMAERPYADDDDFGRALRTSGAQGVRSDSEALTEVRERVRVIASGNKRDPYLAVPAATLERVDMREVEPPPQFKGTDLEWRLHGMMDPDELADLLRSLRELGPRDRRAVLHRVFREPDPKLAPALVEAKKSVDGPEMLLLYSSASRSMVRRLRQEHGPDGGRRPMLEDAGGDVVQALLEKLARLVGRFGPALDEAAWRGVHAALVQLYEDCPGFDQLQRYRPLVDEIRSGTAKMLVEAAKPVPNYMGGLATVKVGVLLADQPMRDVLLDLLDARAIFNQKIASTESRTDIAFLDLVGGAIIVSGKERHWGRLAMLVADGLAVRDIDRQTRETLVRLGRSLQRKLPENFDGRVTAALRLALDSAEGKKK